MAAAQVLPKELRLSAPPTMPQARSYLFKQQSTQSSYSESQTIQINIPRLQRSYLTKDSYLKLKLSVPFTTEAAAAGLNNFKAAPIFDTNGVLGLIKKIEVYDYLGSTLLESTSGFDALSALLMDLGWSPTEFGTYGNAIMGTRGSVMVDQFVRGDAGAVTTTYDSRESTSGELLSLGVTSTATAATAYTCLTKEYAFPLFSFLGPLSSKYAPLHNGYTINITLNAANSAIKMCSAAGAAVANCTLGTIAISDVYYCAQILELGPVAESMLLSSTQGQPLIIPSKAYRNFTGSVTAGASSAKLDLNLNVASLTNILFIQRLSTNISSPASTRSLSNRIRNYLQSWYFQYGSSVLPQTSGILCRGKESTNATNTYISTECFIELLKARHAFYSPSHPTVLNKWNFNMDVDGGVGPSRNETTSRPTFACGLDLELVSGRSNDIVCGMNTNGMNTSLFLTFDNNATSGGTVVAAQLDAWCEYDAFVNVAPGIATTVSF